MMRSRARLVLAMFAVGGLLAAACVPIVGDRGPERPEPSEPATGPVIATAESGQATFVLHDEGEGCLAVDVQYPGLQSTVDRGCFDEWNTLRETPSCGWIESDPSSGGDSSDITTMGDCDVRLPRVIYGRVTDPAVGFVCVGTFDFEGGGATGVVGARLLERDADGYIFEVAAEGEGPPAHFLSRGGSRIGDPPLDAPSGPIYRFCEALAGVEEREPVYGVDLIVDFDESLRTDDVTVFFQAGLDQSGVNGGTFNGGEAMSIPMRVTPNVFDLEVQVETDTGPILNTYLEWPPEFRDIVLSGEACSGLTRVGVRVGAGVLEGDDQAFDVRFIGSECNGSSESSTTSSTTSLVEDRWEMETVDVEDYLGASIEDAVGEIVNVESIVEVTIDTLGNQNEGGRWCCENPPFTATDLDLINGDLPRQGGDLNGVSHQDLPEYLDSGDRVTLALVGGVALYVFGPDGWPVHPVPPHQAEAINILRDVEARWRGYDSGTALSPLEVVSTISNRYRGSWWGTTEQRVALVLSGVQGYPETCSAADLPTTIDQSMDPRSFEGLPNDVAVTRDRLIEAATSCDYDAILAMVPQPGSESGGDPAYGLDEFWWGATASNEVLARSDRVYGLLRSLVAALAFVPYGVVDNEMEDAATERYFTWPPDYGSVESGQDFVDLVPRDVLERMAGVNDVSVDELIEGVDIFGGYALFRTGIGEDGRWMFALSGD